MVPGVSTERDCFEAMLDRFTAGTRAERAHLALRSLSQSTTQARILIAELSWEVYSLRLWAVLRDENGRTYRSAFAFFQDLADDQLFRQWRYHLALGEGIRAFPVGQRNWLRAQLGRLGVYRAMQMSRVLRTHHDAAAVSPWITRGASSTARDFAMAISAEMKSGRESTTCETCPACGQKVKRARAAVCPA